MQLHHVCTCPVRCACNTLIGLTAWLGLGLSAHVCDHATHVIQGRKLSTSCVLRFLLDTTVLQAHNHRGALSEDHTVRQMSNAIEGRMHLAKTASC